MYDLHPLIVHIPVGLLTVYSLLELACLLPTIRRRDTLPTKLFLLGVGVLGALAALITGSLAGQRVAQTSLARVVQMHSLFAFLSVLLYAGLAIVSYNFWRAKHKGTATGFIARLGSSQIFLSLVALVALGSLSITGGLGGIMVYGPDADPMTHILSVIFHF